MSSVKKQYIFLQPESANLEHFSDGLYTLKQEEADTCKGLQLVTLTECTKLLNNVHVTPGFNGFTIKFYPFFWNAIGQIVVYRFNCDFENSNMSISQKLSIISLIPRKDRQKIF